jgi:hypothetical protein
LVALTIVLGLPSLAVGRALDDHIFASLPRRGVSPFAGFETELLGTVPQLREVGFSGWWAGDDFRIRFMRPLSALSHHLDFVLWPQASWLHHLENVVLLGLLTLVVARLFRRLFGPGPLTGWATLLFAIDEAHFAAMTWISGRNTVLAALFGALTLLLHLRWRGIRHEGDRDADHDDTRARRLAGVGALGCFVLALLSAEAGLSCFGFLLAFAILREAGPWWRRALSLLPYLFAIVVWRVVYTLLDFGARGSDVYADPLADPLGFAA